MDLRVQKTKKAIQEAFYKLMKEKPFEEITVSEICQTAMIRRATFYTHFKDKYDLFYYCISEFSHLRLQQLAPDDLEMTHEEYLNRIITGVVDFINDNPEILTSMAESNVYFILNSIISQELEKTLFKRLETEHNDVGNHTDIHFRTTILVGAIMQVVRWWGQHPTSYTKEEIIQKSVEIIKNI